MSSFKIEIILLLTDAKEDSLALDCKWEIVTRIDRIFFLFFGGGGARVKKFLTRRILVSVESWIDWMYLFFGLMRDKNVCSRWLNWKEVLEFSFVTVLELWSSSFTLMYIGVKHMNLNIINNIYVYVIVFLNKSKH